MRENMAENVQIFDFLGFMSNKEIIQSNSSGNIVIEIVKENESPIKTEVMSNDQKFFPRSF